MKRKLRLIFDRFSLMRELERAQTQNEILAERCAALEKANRRRTEWENLLTYAGLPQTAPDEGSGV